MYPFREGSFAIRNGWYVAAFSTEIAREPVGRNILGSPVVLYRNADGTAVAVGGRCPHRHFPLEKGSLDGDHIVCGYHGLAFAPDGRCVNVPSQDFVPKSFRIPSYPLVEHGLWLWIWPGDPALADPGLLPDLEAIGFTDPSMSFRPLGMHRVEARYQLINDNLLDLSHLGFLHGNTIGTPENTSAPEEVRRSDNLLETRRMIRNCAAPPVLAERGYDIDRIDRDTGGSFYLPGFHTTFGNTSYPQDHSDFAGKMIAKTRVYHGVTPATKNSSNYFFAVGLSDPASFETMTAFLAKVVDEDKFAVEEVEKMIELVGHLPNELLIKSDRAAVEGRRMLQAAMNAESVREEHQDH